jgi:FtsZ-interacting cell division protein ZipA
MNWTVIVIVGIALIALIVFLVRRNAKDEKEFEQQQNNDYHKTKDEEGDIDIEEKLQ